MCKTARSEERGVICVMRDGLCDANCCLLCGVREAQLKHSMLCMLKENGVGSEGDSLRV